MKNAKAMLDALMGPSRDVSKSDKTGEDFKGDNVCQHYLVGFCPHTCFKNVEEGIVQPCQKLHSVALREELNGHPDAAKYKQKYEKALLHKLEDLVKESDARIFRERRRCKTEETITKMPEDVKPTVAATEEKLAAKIKEAEEKGSTGDITGSQEAMASIEKCKAYIAQVTKMYSTHILGECVCEACGVRYLLGKEGDPIGMRSVDIWEAQHMASKLHKGWTEVRSKLAEYKEVVKKAKEDREKEEKETGGKKDRSRSRDRDKDGERGRRDKDRDAKDKDAKDKDRDRDRDNRDRDRDRRDRDRRSRDRDRGRSKDRKYDRRR